MGKYQLIAALGHGGMAKVYLALMAGPGGFNKLMVVKVLRDDVIGNADEAVRMFWDEARLTAHMVHPNIVHTYEVGEIDGRYYLAMEYLDGQTYRAVQVRMEAAGGLPLHEDLRILTEIARGLHYAHELKGFNGEPLGVVHRDVSPQNVFVTYEGQVKLLDFGIAKARSAENMTQVGIIKGKLDYIAPEQLRGDAIDGRADVFALGAMLWEAITKQRFAGGRNVNDVVKAHKRVEGAEPNVRMVRPDVPDVLAEIVDRALALDPAHRFATAAEFAEALDAFLETHPLKPSARSLARTVAPLFVSERAAIQKMIDQQMQLTLTQSGLVELGEETGDLPRFTVTDTRSSAAILGDGRRGSPSGGMRRDLFEATQAASTPHDPAPLRTRRSFVVALMLAAGAGAAVTWFVPHERTVVVEVDRGAPAAPAASAPLNRPPVAPGPVQLGQPGYAVVPSASVIVDLKVVPPEAQVTLDGAPLSLPFSGEFRRSEALHHLEVSAEGHRFMRRPIKFDRDQAIELVLEPLSDRASRRRAAPTDSPAPSDRTQPSGDVEPQGGASAAPR